MGDIEKLKNSKGSDIQVHGSGELIQLLLKNDLVDDKRDCILDEWYWNFFQRVHTSNSPEVRYPREQNPDHGFGHKSKIHGFDDKCIPDCRFYEPKGKLTIFDILEDYRGYQQFEQVWQAYKELESSEIDSIIHGQLPMESEIRLPEE